MSDQVEFFPGDPADHVLGKREERPARVHAPQGPKPPKPPITAAELSRQVKGRIAELKPAVSEYERLSKAAKALKKI